MGVTSAIPTQAPLILLAVAAASCLACAKGTEISQEEIVFLPLSPAAGADAGVDAAAPPSEPVADEAAVTTGAPAAEDSP